MSLSSLSPRQKILLLACGIAFSTALVVGFLNYLKTSEISGELAIEKLAGHTRQTTMRIKAAYGEMKNDAFVVANTPPIQGLIRSRANDAVDPVDGSTEKQWKQRLAQIFSSFIKTRPHYTQIRYIGLADEGRELVRVNRRKGQIEVSKEDDLQPKAKEPYFKEGAKLEPNQHYFSPVTLNRENGKIDPSVTPTLRLVVPVYDADNQPFGMLIINANYETLIKGIFDEMKSNETVYVIDSHGNYMFRTANGVSSALQMAGRYTAPAPSFIYDILTSRQAEQQFSLGKDFAYYASQKVNPSQPDYSVGVLSLVPLTVLYGGASQIWDQALVVAVAALLIGLASMFAGRLSDGMAQPISRMTGEIRALREGKFDVSNLPVDEKGEVGELARAFRDLTEKLDLSQAAQARLSVQLDAFIQNAVDGFIIIDEIGTIQQVNPACVALFGYEAEDLVGQNVSMLMPEAVQSKHDGYLKHYRDTDERRMIGSLREEEARRRDGSIFPIALSISEVWLGDRRIFTGILRDLTDQKRQEAALRASEETFRSAMHDASIGMALVDGEDRWLEFNEALRELLGYSEDELRQMTLHDIVHPDDRRVGQEQRRRIIAGEIKNYHLEKRYITKSGRIVWVDLSVSLTRRGDSSKPCLIMQAQDISARKEMERMKDEFVSMVSHELRTPLTSIRGALALILASRSQQIPENTVKLLNIAHKNSERLILLINDILDMEKIAAGKMDFDIQDTDLVTLARQAADANGAYAQDHGVTLSLTLPEDAVPIRGDETRLMQVMSNLLSNAAKFSPSGAEIQVVLERFDEKARLSVIDRGSGIPEELRSRIFQRFSQGDSSANREKGGTGLGLHITKQIIEKLGGLIGFESAVGEGTTFWIELPLRGSKTFEADEQETMPQYYYPRVLLLDEEGELSPFAERLSKAGFRTLRRDDSKDPISHIDMETIDMLLIDLPSEGNGSSELFNFLRANPAVAAMPTLIVSGQTQWNDEAKCTQVIDSLRRMIEGQKTAEKSGRPQSSRSRSYGLPTILHIEDDTDLSAMLSSALNGRAIFSTVQTLAEAKTALRDEHFDLVILDITLPDGSGLDLLDDLAHSTAKTLVLSAEELPRSATNISTAFVKSRMPEDRIVTAILALIGDTQEHPFLEQTA